MKKSKILCGLIGVLAILGLSSPAYSLPLMVDFESTEGVTETGYTRVSEIGAANSVGGAAVWIANGVAFDRNTVSSRLLDDFIYTYNGSSIWLSIHGLDANTAYDVRFYSSDRFNDYDNFATQVKTTFTADGTYTTGSPVSITYDRTVDPADDFSRSILGQFTTMDTGILSFFITAADALGGGKDALPVVNAMEINAAVNAVPEPATMFLLGSGLIGVGVFVRKKFKR